MMIALVSFPQRMFLTTSGVIPGWIFRIETLVSRSVLMVRLWYQSLGFRMYSLL